jgi:polyhydroxyalkanoate synthase
VRTFVLDWGDLATAERGFDLTAFITQRLEPAIAQAREHGLPVVLAGYCMGGNLALAAGLRSPEPLAGLVLLATPWDFHAERAEQAKALGAAGECWASASAALGALPVDLLQALFVWLDPLLGYRKMRQFAELAAESSEARLFVALEDWLNDGVPLPLPVAQECFAQWYGENRPAAGRWRVANSPVRPQDFRGEMLAITPRADRIVPPASAEALARGLPGAALVRADAGHIGMMAGSRAERECWKPVAEWILARVNPAQRTRSRASRLRPAPSR